MTAVETRPLEDDLDLTPWQCPRCGYANDGIRGFCAGCRLRRPAPETEPAVRRSTPQPTSKRGNRPTPPPRLHQDPAFGAREILATVLIVVVFMAGLLAAVVRTTEHTSSIATPSLPGSSGATAKQWDPRVLDVVQFVERRRGLQFKHPVPMDFLDDAAFDKKVTNSDSPSASQRNELNDSVAGLRAVGLAEGTPDLQAAENKVASNSILGLYSPKDKRVFVRGSNLTPDVRVTLAHELTHTLQDQYFGLDRLGNGDSGVDTAFRALAEADATRVEDSYVASLSSADAKAFEATRQKQTKQADVPDVPEVIIDNLAFPYVFGPAFVAALEDQGGNDAVNRAFKKPPQSEAQIVDPQSYLAGVAVTKVPAPELKGGQKRIEKAHDIGQVSMLELLGDRLPYDLAWGALKAWTGDQGFTYRENGKVCFAGDTALKDPASAGTFEVAARAWAAAMPAASITRLSPTVVDLRSCDPGPAYTHAVPQPSAFKTLSVRSEYIELLHQGGLKYTLAACTADGVIAKLGVAPLLAINDITSPDDPRLAPIQRATRQAVVTCQRSGTI